MLDEDDDYSEDEPSAEELALIRQATPAQVAAVDALILGKCEAQWRKVAMIVGSSWGEFDALCPELPIVFIQLRIQALVNSGVLEGQGNLMMMRHSEIRLTPQA